MSNTSSTLHSYREFRRFRERLDSMLAEAWELYKSKMACRAGCSACCRGDFRISLIEALVVKGAVAELPESTQAKIHQQAQNPDPDRCPLLINDQCSIYAERPLLCRIFGFPITDGTAMATCELNFTEEREQMISAKSFDKRVITESLEVLSRLYMQETGQALPEEATPPVFHIVEIFQPTPS